MVKIGRIVIFLCCVLNSGSSAGVGESAVSTLVFPFGARSGGMGEVGTALADDESALYFNPAGLGVPNERWQWGAVSYYHEPLLRNLGIRDLAHYSFSGYFQPPPDTRIGGFGAYYNHYKMGRNLLSDALGNSIKFVNSWEGVFALGWGFNLKCLGDSSRHYGIAIKPFISALAPGLGEHGEGTARGIAVDIGLLRLFRNGLRFGFTMMNMGQCVYYIKRSASDPIPFSINWALGYKKNFYKNNIRLLDVAGELRCSKELVINNFDGKPDPFYKAMFRDLFNDPLSYELQEIVYQAGIEIGFLETVFYRHGFTFDCFADRNEMTMGGGLRIFRHLNADYSIIISPEGFMKPAVRRMDKDMDGTTGLHHLQWRLNFTFTGIGKFKRSDLAWWTK
ncbi:MAG TPA: PorV/PorQ family protein [Chitinispirillaceae bacterium]|nr:PorV/PorQ family protein [Chitinispirillaceae bacterium]